MLAEIQNKRPAEAGLEAVDEKYTSALTGLVALVDLVDDVHTAAAADELVGTMAKHQSLERVGNLHSNLGRKQKEARRALELALSLKRNMTAVKGKLPAFPVPGTGITCPGFRAVGQGRLTRQQGRRQHNRRQYPEQQHQTFAMQKQSFAKLDVLVCDPSQNMGTLIGQMLRHLKVHALEEVQSSTAALTSLTNRQFGVIMLDDQLGPTDSIELVKALRANENGLNRATPVIMMSSAPEAARILAARDAGVTEFLRKPFAAVHVESRLTSIFGAPREFVDGGGYKGPDRRRKRVEFKGNERRGAGAAAPDKDAS
jgi:CheY-like chemotaxis protein